MQSHYRSVVVVIDPFPWYSIARCVALGRKIRGHRLRKFQTTMYAYEAKPYSLRLSRPPRCSTSTFRTCWIVGRMFKLRIRWSPRLDADAIRESGGL